MADPVDDLPIHPATVRCQVITCRRAGGEVSQVPSAVNPKELHKLGSFRVVENSAVNQGIIIGGENKSGTLDRL